MLGDATAVGGADDRLDLGQTEVVEQEQDCMGLIEAVDRYEFLVLTRAARRIRTTDPVNRDQAAVARLKYAVGATLRWPPRGQITTRRNAAEHNDHRCVLRTPGLPGQCAVVQLQATGQTESTQRQYSALGRRTSVLAKLLTDLYCCHDALCRCVQGAATLRRAERSSSPGIIPAGVGTVSVRCGCLGI